MGPDFGKDIMVVLFATTVGFTVSGILANLYRLIAGEAESSAAKHAYYALMVVAGPNVILEKAADRLRTKACSWIAFWLVAALAAYWSFAIGLFVLDLGLSL